MNTLWERELVLFIRVSDVRRFSAPLVRMRYTYTASQGGPAVRGGPAPRARAVAYLLFVVDRDLFQALNHHTAFAACVLKQPQLGVIVLGAARK
jgi:hypothetical protein